ncbi:MAG TPA: hypothetical protein PKD85_05180, partial [Saprospiraceae bacterium]|nr:hypothetical protein [Saprospiraceae bacterium]
MSSDQKSNHKIKVGDIEQKIENSIEDDDVWRAVESFVQENGMVSGQIRSFNDFIYNKSHEIIKLFKQVVIEEKSKDSPKKYVLELSDLTYKEPFFTEKDDSTHDLYPVEALQRNITYCSAMYIDVTVITPSGESTFYEKIFLGNMPVMTRSDLCHVGSIVGDPEQIAKNNEDFYDGGGYFVISPKGEGSVAQRRILVPQERSAPNKVYIFSNRKMHPKYQKYAEIRSSGDHVHMTTTTVGFMPSGYNGRISAVLPWIDATEIPLGVLFFALGATSYQEICTFVVGPPNEGDKWTDESTKEILGILLTTLEYSFEIQDQESALYFIGKKGRKFVNDKENGDLFDKDFSDEEDEIDMAAILKEKSSAISYARHLLTSEFLSHVGNHFDTSEEKAIEKAKYLGYVVNKLILVILGKKNPESRDHYMNKRILSTGALLAQQFYGGLRRLIMEITKNTRKALRYGNTVNISSWIKPSIITNAMQGAISGNNWTTGGPAAKGISQVYEQFNYASSIANARKDTVPIAADGGKVIEPRDLHGTHFGLICVTGDTLVLLADGKTLCRIDELENKAVMTVNTVSLKSEPSGIYNFFKMMPKQLLEIKDDCGRVLKCTPDHPFLVHIDGENVWVSAGNLKIGDKVVVENTNHFKPGSDTIVLPIKNLSYELKSTGLLNPIDEKKAGIIAGLLGASFTNGHICKKEGKYLQSEFYLGELNDALELQEDIYRLGFGSSYIGRKHTIYKCDGQEPMNYATWVVTKGGDFARMLVDLGAPVGKKGTQTLKTPLWIKNAPNFVKKEWLSAFQGGDGSKLGMWKNQKTFKISLNSTIIRNSKNETMEFFTDMVEMYEHFGIQCFLETKEKNYILSFAGNRENLFKYSQLIDYKYCNHKKRASSIVINFLKHWNYKQTKQKAIYDKVLKASSFNINLGVTKNQYYKIRNNKNVNPRPIIDISLFQNRSLLEGKCISYISEISEIELEPVYDFTTISENHSFISNEFVTHQCPSETPEGKKAGLVKNMAFMSLITLGTDFEPIR